MARPVFPSLLKKEKNVSLIFIGSFLSGYSLKLVLTGYFSYQVFVNGRFVHYGPARGANGHYRVDSLRIDGQEGLNRLAIVLSSPNDSSFMGTGDEPFLLAELFDGSSTLLATGVNLLPYRNPFRYEKVVRFSYQRDFSESYNIDKDKWDSYFSPNGVVKEKPEEISLLNARNCLPRYADYPSLSLMSFSEIEEGHFWEDSDKPVHHDRYMDIEYLGIYPPNEWEIDYNRFVSRLVFLAEPTDKNPLQSGSFLTFAFERSLTGFIHLHLRVEKKATVVMIFDEMSKINGGTLDFDPFRNTTQNVIGYELGRGEYDLLSAEPYTAHYLRLIVKEGEVFDPQVGVALYENPLIRGLRWNLPDPEENNVMKAAVNTYAQNSVDLFTDCPSRERAGWLSDSYFSGFASLFIEGSNKIEKSFLENYSFFRGSPYLPSGMIPMCYPASFPSGDFIVNWGFYYILELDHYIERYGPPSFIEDSKSLIKGFLNYVASFHNEDGLLENLPGWIFVEWSEENEEQSTEGVNYPSNFLYGKALKCAGHVLGDPSLCLEGEKVIDTCLKQAWNGSFFADNSVRDGKGKLHLSGRQGETSNYFAFVFGEVGEEGYSSLYQSLIASFGPKRDSSIVYPTIYPSNVLPGYILRLILLMRDGHYSLVLEETKEYFEPMAIQTGTLWENDKPGASLNHGFTSFLAKIIIEASTGLRDILPKEKTIVFSPFVPCRKKGDAFVISLPNGEELKYENGSFIIPSGYKAITN